MSAERDIVERLCELHTRLSHCFEGAMGERPPSRPRPFEPQFADLDTLLDAATRLREALAQSPEDAELVELLERFNRARAAIANWLSGVRE